MPAFIAASTPASASSNTIQRGGSTPIAFEAAKKISGAGLAIEMTLPSIIASSDLLVQFGPD
jgi:hypothetical protein